MQPVKRLNMKFKNKKVVFLICYRDFRCINVRIYVDWKGVMKAGREYTNMDKDF